jgi:hypothetical protein
MTIGSASQTVRRMSVMRQLATIIDRHNATQESVGLPPVDSVAGASGPERLEQIEGLVRMLRGRLCTDGEVPQPMVLATGAQLVAWLIALEERDETRIDVEAA